MFVKISQCRINETKIVKKVEKVRNSEKNGKI